jgi:hypothetical protein
MIQRRQRFGFALEARAAIGVAGQRVRQNLDGDIAAQFGVVRAVHLAHPACAEGGDDFVGSDTRAGDKAHVTA